MKQEPKATIVILNWNGEKFLKENLPSVLDQTYSNYEILLVDNGSKDISKKVMLEFKKKNQKVKILETGSNLGYVGGNNKGMEKVLKENKSDYIVILNNDVKVDKNWLEILLGGFRDSAVGICTSKVLLYYPFVKIKLVATETDVQLKDIKINDLSYFVLEYGNNFYGSGSFVTFPKTLRKGEIYYFAIAYNRSSVNNFNISFIGEKLKIQTLKKEFFIEKSTSIKIDCEEEYIIQNAGSMLNRSRMTFDERYHLSLNRSIPSGFVDAACGAAMAIRTDLLKRYGLLREKYFMYYEDGELSYRFQKEGFKTKFVSDAICYHYYMGSHGGKISSKHIFHGVKNKLWFTRRYFGLFYYLLFFIKTLARSILFLVQTPFKKEAKESFVIYLKALKYSLKKDT